MECELTTSIKCAYTFILLIDTAAVPWLRAGLEPTVERDNGERPTKSKTCDGHSYIEKHHDICSRFASGRQRRCAQHGSPSRPLRMAVSVTSSVLSMKVRPPQARKKLARASVGGREGKTDRGGASQRKKYVRHRRTEKPRSMLPHRACI
jgi:hypothetical protein